MTWDGFEGERVVVTGGASGIGRAAVMAFAEAGARLVVADIDGKGTATACADARNLGAEAEPIGFDLSDTGSVRAAADAILAGGAPRVLVNAAGWDRLEPFLDNSDEFSERVVRLNLMGPITLTRTLLPAMIEAGDGRIVNLASDAGRAGSSGETVYAGAKGGIIAFTKSLAREMARKRIRVNCVSPGPTDTPLFATLPEKMRTALVRAIPFGRLATPEEVAEAILFFASSRSGFVTGQVLSVSGGLTMND